MNEMYDSEGLNSSSGAFLAAVGREIAALPRITRLDEYEHFREQLEQMRARSIEYNPARFAMEIAVYLALTEYEESLGLPPGPMPKPDGRGGIEPEAVVPEGWL